MRITDEKITAYSPTFKISHSRYQYIEGGNGPGTHYYLFVLPNTAFESAQKLGVALYAGYANDENSKAYHVFTEPVHFNSYSSGRTLQSLYNDVDRISTDKKSEISFNVSDANYYTGIYFTDSRYNKYIIVKAVIRGNTSNLFLLASCVPSSSIVTDSWLLLKNGETENLICNTPLLIKTNHDKAITVTTSGYTIVKPGIVYYIQTATYESQIMIVNKGDVLNKNGYLYYILEIA